jgi:hypothetical protein
MRSNWWKVLYRHPTNVFFAGVLWGALFVAIGLYETRYVTHGLLVLGHVPSWIGLACVLFFAIVFVAGIVFLLTARFFAAFCYLATGCMMYVPLYALEWLKGDRFTFTSGPHSEIADIYVRRQSEFTSQADLGPRLVALNNQCNLPYDCQCWIALDPGHTSGVEQDIGGWHRPRASLVASDNWAEPFAIIDVKRLDADTYSVLSCYGAWNSWGNPL